MLAAWYEAKGAARDVLRYGELPDPVPAPGEVRVLVRASGVNPTDVKARMGRPGSTALEFSRVVPHHDGAGVVDRVGEGVSQRRIGERVWIYEAQWKRRFGTAAQYVTVPEEQAVPLPDATDFAAGACLGIAAITAHHCLFGDGPIGGRSVLVQGAAGAVESLGRTIGPVWGNASLDHFGDATPYLSAAALLMLTFLLGLGVRVKDPHEVSEPIAP